MRLKSAISAAVTGVVITGAAWAGIGLAPVPDPHNAEAPRLDRGELKPVTLRDGSVANLGTDEVLAGAAKVIIDPQDDEPNGKVWEKTGCATIDEDAGLETLTHVPNFDIIWPEKPNCIYLGGYGIGPMNPMTSVDDDHLWVRTTALQDAQGDTTVMTVIDGIYWFGKYRTMCDRCGSFDMAEDLGDELGIDPSGFIFAATHSHTAPDFIGGWGGVPKWYMHQVRDAIKDSVRAAVETMEPAVLYSNDTLARGMNSERRDTYRSAEDATLPWFRAVSTDSGRTIATVGAYSAHAVNADEGGGVGDADYPVEFAKTAEARFGGVGMVFVSGLGNESPRSGPKNPGETNWEAQGRNLAELIPDQGRLVKGGDVRSTQEFMEIPVTNSALSALALPGFFDRPFLVGPASLVTGKSPSKRPCVSASPVSVHTAVSVVRVGDLTITASPGEIFSNISSTFKEKLSVGGEGTVIPIGAGNDALGYIIQSFEFQPEAQQGLGFVSDGHTEYEDAYSIDRCFGDHVVERTLAIGSGL